MIQGTSRNTALPRHSLLGRPLLLLSPPSCGLRLASMVFPSHMNSDCARCVDVLCVSVHVSCFKAVWPMFPRLECRALAAAGVNTLRGIRRKLVLSAWRAEANLVMALASPRPETSRSPLTLGSPHPEDFGVSGRGSRPLLRTSDPWPLCRVPAELAPGQRGPTRLQDVIDDFDTECLGMLLGERHPVVTSRKIGSIAPRVCSIQAEDIATAGARMLSAFVSARLCVCM